VFPAFDPPHVPIAAATVVDEGAARELAAKKERAAALEARVAALEAQVKAAGTARGALTDQLADMTATQQVESLSVDSTVRLM